MINNDYDIPFDGMSEEEFLYRINNEEDEMYMGDIDNYIEEEIVIDDIDDSSDEDCEEEDQEENQEENEEEEEMDEELEDIKYTLECEWNYCDSEDDSEDDSEEKDFYQCEVWNLRILSFDGKKYSVSFDLQPNSNDETMRIPLTATLTKDDDTLIVTNLDELKKIKQRLL